MRFFETAGGAAQGMIGSDPPGPPTAVGTEGGHPALLAPQPPHRGHDFRKRCDPIPEQTEPPACSGEHDSQSTPGVPLAYLFCMPPSELEIVGMHGDAEIARYTVAAGEYLIGRSAECSIPIQFGAVSRMHVRLLVDGSGDVQIEDLNSANGTGLDGQLITGPTRWEPGQTLFVGDVALHLLAIPTARPLDEYAPTLAPSLFSEAGTPLTPVTPSNPTPITALDSVGSFASEADIIRKHLPLVSREAQRLEPGKEIARGGMGAVLSARESATRRTVAMKVMLRGDDAKGTLRFIEEAQVTAQLEHPNIVPVYDLSVDGFGQPFYTMKLVSGITLKKVLELIKEGRAETVKKYSLGTLLTAFQKMCDALAFAHSKGVVHRDLKPANIMLGKFGEVLVMDWGLAKILGRAGTSNGAAAHAEDEVTIGGARGEEQDVFGTMAGSVMGTPHYMSPEQARGENDTLDQRSDVFTLGVMLYEILTLERPYSGRNAGEIISKIIEGSFVAPSQRVSALPPIAVKAPAAGTVAPAAKKAKASTGLPHLPGGRVPVSLDAIVRKAMALDPARRYRSVPELQADLTAYQNGFATNAEGVTAWKQFRFFVARNRRVATAIGGGLLVLAISSAAFTWRVVRERERAELGEAAARNQTVVAEMNTEAAQLVNLAQSDPEDALIRAMKAVEKSRSLFGTVSPAVQFGLTSALERHRVVGGSWGSVGNARLFLLSDASRRTVKFGENNACEIQDAITGRSIKRLSKLGTGDPTCAAISDDGGMIGSASEGKEITAWIEGSGQPDTIRSWKAHDNPVRAMAFERGSRVLLSIDATGVIKTWKARETPGAAEWKVEIPGGRVGLAVIGADARTLIMTAPGALSMEAFVVRLGSSGGAPVVTTLRGHSARISAVAVSADGTKVATADSDGLARVWTTEGQLIGGPFTVQRGIVNALAFSPSGDQIAAAGNEETAAVFSFHGAVLHGPFTLKTLGAEGIAISGRGVLYAGQSDYIDILGMESTTCLSMDRPVEDIAVSPDESKLAALSITGAVQIWDLASRSVIAREQAVDGRGSFLSASPDGRLIACASETGDEVRFIGWDGRKAAPPLKLGAGEKVGSMAIFPASGWLAVATTAGRLIFHDPNGRGADEVISFAPSGARTVASVMAVNAGGMIVRFALTPAESGEDKNVGRLVRFTNERKEILNVTWVSSTWIQTYVWRTMALVEPNPRALIADQRELSFWALNPRAVEAVQPLVSRAPGSIRVVSMLGADTFAASTDRGSFRLFNLTGEPLTPWVRRDQRAITAVLPLVKSQQIVTADGDGRVRFWNAGVDRWMGSAARHLSNLERVQNPKTEEDHSLVKLVSRHRPPEIAQSAQLTKLAAPKPEPSVVASKMPAGWKAIPGTPLAWAVPKGWVEVPQEKIALINRLAAGLFSKQRTAEFDIVASLAPEGKNLSAILADGQSPWISVLRVNSGSTPADVARLSREGLKMLQKAFAGGQAGDLVPGQQFNSEALRGIRLEWNEKYQALTSTLEVSSANGDQTRLRAMILPTREQGYIVAVRAGGEHLDKTFAQVEDLFAGLRVPAELRVDDAFRSALRSEIIAPAAEADTKAMISARSEEFKRKRDQACGLIDAGNIEEGRKLGDEAIRAAEELEKADSANAGKWMLEGARAIENIYSRIHTKGKGGTALDLAERGLAKAKEAQKALGSIETETAVGAGHHRLGDAFRMLSKRDEAAEQYKLALPNLRDVPGGAFDMVRAKNRFEVGLKWSGMEWNERKDAAAANAALDLALEAQRQIIAAGVKTHESIRLLFDETPGIVERIAAIRGAEALRKYLGEILSALDSRQSLEGLEPNSVRMLARFTARVQSAFQKNPGSAVIKPEEFATRALFWLDRLERLRPLNEEEAGWRTAAEAVVRK